VVIWIDAQANMCMQDLEVKLSPKTKVILFVHWGGTPVDLDAVDAVVDRCEVS
jgi:dTDP-4-amino-4,6-dideoxygalactose transaminase